MSRVVDEVIGQVRFGDQRVGAGHHRGRAQHVGELADVARPGAAPEHAHHGRADLGRAVRAFELQDAPHQRRQVGAFAQRRQAQRQAVQAVIEVFAELLLLDHFAQVAVGGNDQRDVDRDSPLAVERRDAALLQHLQQPGLQRQRHVADFVEEQRAAVGLHDAALRALAARAGEGAVFAAEEFGLDLRLVDRSAVHHHEGLLGAAGILVKGARQQLLAGAGFTENQQRNVAVDDAPHLLYHGLDLRIAGLQEFQPGLHFGRACGSRRAGRRCHGGSRFPGVGDRAGERGTARRACSPVGAGMHMETRAAGHAQLHRQLQRRTEVVGECRHAGAEQARQRVRAQRHRAHVELVERAAVGAEDLAAVAEHENAFEQGADELDPAVEVNAQPVAVVVAEPVVLDHARRHAHQAHRVLVERTLVARHVEHAQHVAARVEDRRGRAGEEVVGVHEVLAGMHERGHGLEQRGADRVRAFRVLGPVHARRQRDLAGTAQEVVVADRVQDRALRVGQHDHAFGAGDLLEQHFHHRRGMRKQALVALARDGQVAAHHRLVLGPLDARQAEGVAALVRLLDQIGMARLRRDRQHLVAR